MRRRFHLAVGVAAPEASIADDSTRLAQEPECVVPGVHALWRTATLNLSIRVVDAADAGQLRHLRWEEPDAVGYADPTFIRRLFRRRVGLAPGAYRRMFGPLPHPCPTPVLQE
jgi:hypothetical protein